MGNRRQSWVKLLWSVLLCLGLLHSLAPEPVYTQDTDLTVTVDEIDMTEFPTVKVMLRARNRNGAPISGLEKEHFEIVEDGRMNHEPATLREVENAPDARVSLILVIDVYSTLRGAPMEAAQEATEDLLMELLNEPNDPDRAAFVAVRQGVTTDPDEIDAQYEVPFTNDRGKLLNEIRFLHERIDSSGAGTPLYDAVVKAVRMAETEPVGHRAVIVMSDGYDRGSTSTADDTIRNARDARTPVFTVGLSKGQVDEQYMARLADQTGGTYQLANTSDDFSPLFMNVLTMLRTQYQLTYQSSLSRDGREHSLLIHVRTPTKIHGYTEEKVTTSLEATEEATAEPTATLVAGTTNSEFEKSGGGGSDLTPATDEDPDNGGSSSGNGDSEEDLVTRVRDWVTENKLLAILIIVGAGLILIALVVLIVYLITRDSSPAEEAEADAYAQVTMAKPPAYPTPPAAGEQPPPGGGATDVAERPTASALPVDSVPGPIGDQPFSYNLDSPAPTMAVDGQDTQEEVSPTAYAAPGSPPAAPAWQPGGQGPFPPPPTMASPPSAQPSGPQQPSEQPAPPSDAIPPSGGTQILERGPRMPVRGVLIKRDNPQIRHQVARPQIVIGRSQEADIVLDHGTISRRHAMIRLQDDELLLHDMGSSNGTFLDDQRVREPVALDDGAVVRFGNVEFVFEITRRR